MKLPRSAEIWLPGYVRDRARHLFGRTEPVRLWVAITDHYEPLGGKVSSETARQRVSRWQEAGHGSPTLLRAILTEEAMLQLFLSARGISATCWLHWRR